MPVQKADETLYAAKHSGKNTIRIASRGSAVAPAGCTSDLSRSR